MVPALGAFLPALATHREPRRPPCRRARHRLSGRGLTAGTDPGTLRAAALTCLALAAVGAGVETAAATWSAGTVGTGWAGVAPSPDPGEVVPSAAPSPQTVPSSQAPQGTGSANGLLAPGSPVRLTVEVAGGSSPTMLFDEIRLDQGSPEGCAARNATVRAVGTRRDASGGGTTVEADLFLGAAAAPVCRGARFTVSVAIGTDGLVPGPQITVETSQDPRSWRVKTLRPAVVVGAEGVQLSWSSPRKADAGGPMWVEQFDTNGVWKVLHSAVSCTQRSCSATVSRDASGQRRFRVGYRLGTQAAPRPTPGPATTAEDDSPAALDDGTDQPWQDPLPRASAPQGPPVEPEDGTGPTEPDVTPEPSVPAPGDSEGQLPL
jgi:hypothetical protein